MKPVILMILQHVKDVIVENIVPINKHLLTYIFRGPFLEVTNHEYSCNSGSFDESHRVYTRRVNGHVWCRHGNQRGEISSRATPTCRIVKGQLCSLNLWQHTLKITS